MRGTSKLCYYYQCGWSIGPHRVCTSVIKRKKKRLKILAYQPTGRTRCFLFCCASIRWFAYQWVFLLNRCTWLRLIPPILWPFYFLSNLWKSWDDGLFVCGRTANWAFCRGPAPVFAPLTLSRCAVLCCSTSPPCSPPSSCTRAVGQPPSMWGSLIPS